MTEPIQTYAYSANILDDLEWRDCRGEGLQCSNVSRHLRCPNDASLALHRGTKRKTWWAYCEDHAFGRVILSDGIYYTFETEYPPKEIEQAFAALNEV